MERMHRPYRRLERFASYVPLNAGLRVRVSRPCCSDDPLYPRRGGGLTRLSQHNVGGTSNDGLLCERAIPRVIGNTIRKAVSCGS